MQENTISSRKNAIIKETASLLNSAETRKREKLFLIEGARLCADAAISGTGIFRLFYTEKAYGKYKNYIDIVKEKAKEIYVVQEHVSTLLQDTKSSQGVFAVCNLPREKGEIKGKILVFENIQDPANMGAGFRTAEALGIESFALLGDCCDPYSPKVTRSSMGAVFRMNINFYSDSQSFIKTLNELGYSSFAAVPDAKAKDITKVTFGEKSAVFIGNEGSGLSKDTIANCSEKVTIPMRGRAESLNASAAAAILMWEMIR